MIKYKNVKGSEMASRPIVVGKDTVYVHTNIRPSTNDDNTIVEGEFIYDETQYEKNEYIKLMSDDNASLKKQLANLQLLTVEIYQKGAVK